MIELPNGNKLEYVAASGTLGFDGKGWPLDKLLKAIGLLDLSQLTVVMKTVTMKSTAGNFRWYKPWNLIRFIEDGIINTVGLTNPGIEWWYHKIGPKVNNSKVPLIGSIFSDNINEIKKMATMLNDSNLVGIELNEACPNICGDHLQNADKVVADCKALYEESCHPIILKLSVIHPIEKIIPQIEGIVEAISINSVPWLTVFPNRKSPLAHFENGGVSGKAAQSFTWDMVKRIIEITDIPVIGPSVWEFSDIGKLENMGAKAISLGSVFFHPLRLRRILKSIEKDKAL